MMKKPLTAHTGKAMIIAIVAGFLLIIAGVNGVATWGTIKNFVTSYIMDNGIVEVVFVVLIFIASLGGIGVIAGGLLIGKDKIRTGKFLICIGAGFGIIGLIVTAIVACFEKNLEISSFLSIGTIGLILSVVARMTVKKE